mgnify:CR=1 FL=1
MIEKDIRFCVIITAYNNAGTVLDVVNDARKHCCDIIVVCDGPTDDTDELLRSQTGITLVSYPENRGKGYALTKGFEKAREMGFRYAVTMDADGQHKADDLPIFAEALRNHPDSLIIGSRSFLNPNMPNKSSFANRFSNFWFTVQTGRSLPDTQTGFRLYPIGAMKGMKPLTKRYEAELEIMVRLSWRRIPIIPVNINVFYPEASERVSFFRPGTDFVRISLLNTILCFLAIVYGYPSMAVRCIGNKLRKR